MVIPRHSHDRQNRRIRVGFVGAGQNTRSRHIPGLCAIDGVEIVAVCNRRRQSAERVAAEFDIPHVYDDWPELVAGDDIDAVVIGTWPNLHCPVTLAALAADKHVLCEARLAMDAAEARQMRDAALGKSNLVAQVVPAPMTLGVDDAVVRLIRSGALGRCLAIRMNAGGTFLDRQAPLHWRQDRRLSGLNVMSLGIWYECLMRWVGEASRVFAMGRVFTTERSDRDGALVEIQIPEHLDVVADMACGAQANFQISDVTGHDVAPGIWLFGESGTLHFTNGKLYYGGCGDAGLELVDIPPHEAAGWRVEAEFIGAIRGDEQVRRTTFSDGVRYMEFTESVHRSLRSGRVEQVV